MQTQRIGRQGPTASRVAFGCMTLGGTWDTAPLDRAVLARAHAAVEAALDAGITLFDHADIYCRGKSETVFGEILRATPGLRERIVLQSKCGIVVPPAGSREPARYDFSRAHIVSSVDGILTRLGVSHLDVLLLHRPDPLVEPEDVAAAFSELEKAGKVRAFGVSNHTPAQIELLRRFVEQPLCANQVELSLVHCHLIDQGVTVNQGPMQAEAADTLEYCRLHDITLQAYSPLFQGYLSGRAILDDLPNAPRARRAAHVVAELAAERGVSAEAIVIAWLLRHPARIQPVIGTLAPERIRAAAEADALELSRVDWYRLYVAGRGDGVP